MTPSEWTHLVIGAGIGIVIAFVIDYVTRKWETYRDREPVVAGPPLVTLTLSVDTSKFKASLARARESTDRLAGRIDQIPRRDGDVEITELSSKMRTFLRPDGSSYEIPREPTEVERMAFDPLSFEQGEEDAPEFGADGCGCTPYVVDHSDPEPYHPENVDYEVNPSCRFHGVRKPDR